MNSIVPIPQQLEGVLLTDQRSDGEAVMLIWLTPAGGTLIGRILPRHAIVGALHITRGKTNGVSFDTTSAPELVSPKGRRISALEGSALSGDMRHVLERLRDQLNSRQSGGTMAELGGLADHLCFHVFDTGEGPVGPDWAITYAGVRYPMRAVES